MPRDILCKFNMVITLSCLVFLYINPVWAKKCEDNRKISASESEEEKFYLPEDIKQAQRHFEQGKKYHLKQKYHQAIKEYQKALSLYPDLTKARRALAWAKRDLQRKRRSDNITEYSLDTLVREAKDHYKRGCRYERDNKLLEAAAAYKDALRLIPGYPEAKAALRRVQSQVQRTLAPLPYSATASSSKAPQAHKRQDMTSAGSTLQEIKPRTHLSQSSWESPTRKTELIPGRVRSSFSRQQQSSEAQQSIRSAIRKHYLVGCQSLDQGDYAAAVREFELILEFEPEHREAQYKLNEAKKKQALEIKTVKRKAELAKSKGDTMGALSALRDIVNIDPNNKEALEAWEKIKRENKEIVNEIYHKGVNAYAKGEYNLALQAWELVLDIDPQHAKAQESIKKVREKMELIK